MPLYDPKTHAYRLQPRLDGVPRAGVGRVDTEEGWAEVYDLENLSPDPVPLKVIGNWSVVHPDTGEVNPSLERVLEIELARQATKNG